MGAAVNALAEAKKQARVTTETDFIFLRFLVFMKYSYNWGWIKLLVGVSGIWIPDVIEHKSFREVDFNIQVGFSTSFRAI
jgi:hypothetical protein